MCGSTAGDAMIWLTRLDARTAPSRSVPALG
jgi:hypothetical protein